MDTSDLPNLESTSPEKPTPSLSDRSLADIDETSLPSHLGPIVKSLAELKPDVFNAIETYEPSANIRRSPIVLSCPHAGRIYPAEFIAASIADLTDLRGLEDFAVDQLIGGTLKHGVTCIINKIARAYIDVNRPIDALDHLMLRSPPKNKNFKSSRQVQAGYGLLPRLTAGREIIHRQLLPPKEVENRISLVHSHYHHAIQSALDYAQKKFHRSILIDCHSMPPTDQQNRPLPDFILGDLHHNTLDQKIGNKVAATIRNAGYSVSWNTPYAGGHITRSYGKLNTTQQSVQIEVNRRLYMPRKYILDSKGAQKVAVLLSKISFVLSEIALTS